MDKLLMGFSFETFMPTNAVFVGVFVLQPYDITVYVKRISPQKSLF